MTYEEVFKNSEVAMALIKCTYAELYTPDGRKGFSLQSHKADSLKRDYADFVVNFPIGLATNSADYGAKGYKPIVLTQEVKDILWNYYETVVKEKYLTRDKEQMAKLLYGDGTIKQKGILTLIMSGKRYLGDVVVYVKPVAIDWQPYGSKKDDNGNDNPIPEPVLPQPKKENSKSKLALIVAALAALLSN